MRTVLISKATARRFILGGQGLWPGRRWAGREGTATALRAVEAVQMDPLNVVARSHDIVLWSRVLDYDPIYLDRVLYHDRGFFDYGGALFIYPMEELPFWRVPMYRSESEGHWAAFGETHQALLDEVRAELRRRGPLGNRDFTGRSQVRDYRGRKDSALALYYLWLTGELMIHHRQGFERIYDFREHVAPSAFHHAAAAGEAEQFFARKIVAFHGLISGSGWTRALSGFIRRRVGRAEARRWLDVLVQAGDLIPVAIEGSMNGGMS